MSRNAGAATVASERYIPCDVRMPVSPVSVIRHEDGAFAERDDILVAEEPLEIRLGHGPVADRREFRLSVTMRTPGHDEELALGFLFTEGIIRDAAEVVRIVPCEQVKVEERGNVVRAELRPDVEVDTGRWQRNFYATSSCGVCGKSSIDAVHATCSRPLGAAALLTAAHITSLPEKMRAAQTLFKHTGGIHAAALFDAEGVLLVLREDVGRHNAVDKVIGAMLGSRIPVDGTTLLVSGRAGFELVQKCVMACIPAMVAVGAPSSLAVQLARAHELLLVGFLRGERFNIYSGRLP